MLIQGHDMSVDVVSNNITRFQRYGAHILFPGRDIIYRDGNPVEEIVRDDEVIKPRKTHLCFPNFGRTPDNFPGIPQHGWLRDVDSEQVRADKNLITSKSIIGNDEENFPDYPWEIKCNIDFQLLKKAFEVRVHLSRLDKFSSDAPFTLAQH